jgi:hypothetical protein
LARTANPGPLVASLNSTQLLLDSACSEREVGFGMKRKLTIFALVVGLIGALLATASAAAGDGPIPVPRGYLLLDTSGEGNYHIDWYDDGASLDGDPTATQTLVVDSKCNVSLSGDELITITSKGGTFATGVGAVSHGLGVKTKNNCSTDQALIAPGQKLKISLGSFFSDSVSIIRAEVDVEGKRNAELGVTYLPGGSDTIVLSNTSDNGPDSGTSDNSIATLASGSGFRAVEFYPLAGGTNDPAVAIEGGGDGEVVGGDLRTELGTNASVFELEERYDDELNCGETTFSVGGGATEMGGSFTRLPNLPTSPVCTPKPYNLNVTFSEEFGSTVLFDPEGDQDAAYWGMVSSPDKPATNSTGSTLKYDPSGGFNFVNMKWCTNATFNGDAVTTATLPTGESWCIAAESTVTVGDGDIRTTWTVYGHDDPRMSGG